MHLIPQCIANWSGIGVSSNCFSSESVPFLQREGTELKDGKAYYFVVGLVVWLLIGEQTGQFSSGEFSVFIWMKAWIFKNTHPCSWHYICNLVGNFSRSKSYKKNQLQFHSVRCGKWLMDKHSYDWQSKLPINDKNRDSKQHIKTTLPKSIPITCPSRILSEGKERGLESTVEGII